MRQWECWHTDVLFVSGDPKRVQLQLQRFPGGWWLAVTVGVDISVSKRVCGKRVHAPFKHAERVLPDLIELAKDRVREYQQYLEDFE